MGFEPVWTLRAEGRRKLPKIDVHPAFERMLCRMPAAARSTFTLHQLALLAKITKPPPSLHWIDYRVSLPFFGNRYYLTVLFGKERRLLKRVKSEGQASLLKSSIVYVAVLWFLISVCLISSLGGLYLVKSVLGVDVFNGPSLVHQLVIVDPVPQ
ncbi:MAG: hypothetical protein KJ622_12785 [Alphaproteobacteria bacterium]|nr:hypothetical protein [Alphaproteobacteria bacterium]